MEAQQVHPKDKKLLDKLVTTKDSRGQNTESAFDSLANFGQGFVEGFLWFMQGLLPGGYRNRQDNYAKCDRRNPEPEKLIDPPVLYGVPVEETPLLEAPKQGAAKGTPKKLPGPKNKYMLPEHTRSAK